MSKVSLKKLSITLGGNAIIRALDKHQNNVSRAAEALGLTRASLYRRMEKYGL